MTEWYNYCSNAQWNSPHQLKADLRNASILKNNRVVFNVCGNKYRIVVLTDYSRHGMLIRFVGTHKQYDDELDVLMLLVEKYEEEHYPIPPSDPVEAIKFLMEQKGLTRKDLEPYLGTRARVSEVLNKKRNLTLPMIKKLHEGLNIPYNCLIA